MSDWNAPVGRRVDAPSVAVAAAVSARCGRRDAPARNRVLDMACGLDAFASSAEPGGWKDYGNPSGFGRYVLPSACVAKQAADHRTTPATGSAPKPRRARWRLEFDDGAVWAVTGPGLIGRAPSVAAGETVDHLVALADDTLSVSRTHLEFGFDQSGLWVRDRYSTNGSRVEVDGRRIVLEPGLRVPAPPGCTVHIGARRFDVRPVTGRTVIGGAMISWGVATHVGAVRPDNQDASCAEPPVFVVADGMGGQSAGNLASRDAAAAMSILAGQVPVTSEMLMGRLKDARARIGRIVVDHGRPPGTTLSGVIVTHVGNVPSWMVVNIGDSRTYRLDADGLRQVSVDHSVVQELIDAGAIAPSTARSHPFHNVVTRSLLAETVHPADVWLLPMVAGDRILVCSDGLPREVDDESIACILRTFSDPQAAADELVRAAVEAGGHDNVTAVVVDAVDLWTP